MNTTKDDQHQLSLTDFAEAIETLTREAREGGGSTRALLEAIETLTREVREQDGGTTRDLLEAIEAERELDPFSQRDNEPSPQAAGADLQEIDAVIDADRELDPDGGPSYG